MIEIQGGKPEDIVVFGDGHNDISMMRQAPISIAMEMQLMRVKEQLHI